MLLVFKFLSLTLSVLALSAVKLKFTDIFCSDKKNVVVRFYVREPICAKTFRTEAKMIFFRYGKKAKICRFHEK
jgi:hypothetical protein